MITQVSRWLQGCCGNRSKAAGAALAIAALTVSLLGCGRLDLTGNKVGNSPPDIILVNIPAGGTSFSTNPLVYWYGTDADGRVVRYDYAVVTEDAAQKFVDEHGCPSGRNLAERFINCAGDEDFDWISIFVDSMTAGTLPTQQSVRLFASFDTLDCDTQVVTVATADTVFLDTVGFNCVSTYVPQFMFIRAVDELGAVSQIKYRSFKRNNHWPETTISRDFFLETHRKAFFSRPELTRTYRGIQAIYGGSDRSDYLREIPPLEYYWRVYGPFNESPSTLDDTLMESGAAREPVITSRNKDPRKGVWVSDTIAVIYNLWRIVDSVSGGAPDTTRSGFFLFVVSARDDAFVPDPSPAFLPFEAIDPKFERDILLVADNLFIFGSWGTPTCTPSALASTDATCNQERLKHVAETAAAAVKNNPTGFDPSKDWLEYDERKCRSGITQEIGGRCVPDGTGPDRAIGIPLVDLARHKLVIYDQADLSNDLPGGRHDTQKRLGAYLDIGGKLWLIDRVPFLPKVNLGDKTPPLLIDFRNVGFGWFPMTYFDIEEIWYPGWKGGLRLVNTAESHSNDEFIAAELASDISPELSLLPPRVEVDHEHINNAYVLSFRELIAPDSIFGAPAVPYVIRGDRSRTVYRFVSYRPGLNNTSGAPVGVRFVGPDLDNPRFKTAWFGCPLYWLKEDQVDQMVTGMVDWFLNQPLEVP